MPSASPGTPRGHSFPISYEDLQKHFDQPLADVARKFDVCTTFFKKVCRHYGIKRWPFRKLKSLEKKINALQTKPQPEKSQSQNTLLGLHKKVQQIRSCAAYAESDGSGNNDSPSLTPASEKRAAAPIGFREHVSSYSNPFKERSPAGSKKERSPNPEQEVIDRYEAIVTLHLSSMLRKNIFSKDLVGCGTEDPTRFDSIRGACVFSFEISPSGTSKITFMSRGSVDLYNISPKLAMSPEGIIQMIGAILPEDQASFGSTVVASKSNLSEWIWTGRVRVPTQSGWSVKWIRGRSQPHMLHDGTCKWDGFLFEDGIVNSTVSSPDLLQGFSVYHDMLHGPINPFENRHGANSTLTALN